MSRKIQVQLTLVYVVDDEREANAIVSTMAKMGESLAHVSGALGGMNAEISELECPGDACGEKPHAVSREAN